MRWRKLGQIWDPADAPEWAASHATLPIPIVLEDRVRVIHSVRDSQGRSVGSWLDFVPGEPEILRYASAPSIIPGKAGFFDDSGAMPSTVWMEGNSLHCLYIGWNRGHSVPFRNAIGHATSVDLGATFVRTSDGPVMDRSTVNPGFVASPFVLEEEPERMWYASCIEWIEHGEDVRHRYHLKYAIRTGPTSWSPDDRVCIDFESDDEYAISRPTIVRDASGYRMWFSSRGKAYRIRTATSPDGVTWRRDAGVSLDVSGDGFDSEMTAYPAVFDWEGRRYMLYNGNGYGRSGIGLAEQSDDSESNSDSK